jgi:glycosyltransferase involved in cell wall biosynthesis
MKILIVIPAYNEQGIIKKNVERLLLFCRKNFLSDQFTIVISDNNSSDKTREIVEALSLKQKEVEYFFVNKQGKGQAVILAWKYFDSDAYIFMDADLATDIASLPNLTDPIRKGTADIVAGSRHLKNSKVQRTVLRKFISFNYRMVLKIFLKIQIKDAPCGFKAINRRVRDELLDKVQNRQWFFDSELVVLAEKMGYRVKEIPVSWREPIETGRKSQVKILSLSREYFKKVMELRRRLKKLHLP